MAVISVVALAGCSGNHKTENLRINAVAVNGQSGFSIGTKTVTQGDKVNIQVGNMTDKPHGFSNDEFGIHKVVEPGKSVTVSFTPNKTGEFRVYCQLHPAHVPGRIIVVG